MQRKRLWVRSPHRTPLSLHPGRSLATWAAAVAGVVCIAAGVLLAVGPDGSADVGVAPTAAAVSAAVPNADGGTVPVAVALPDRSVSAAVVPTGTTPDGALDVPDPPTTVGWWSPGALAGATSGTTVLAGHVDSAAAGLGTFAVLRQVGVGERVELRGADGRTLAYRVVARRQLEKAELPADLFARGGPPRLVLITCGGRFDRTARHYTDNVIVYTEPV
jgi:Sortase domain